MLFLEIMERITRDAEYRRETARDLGMIALLAISIVLLFAVLAGGK